ncbi:MAG: glycosyltransferase [Acidobacteria bacterium]|nr:glycosyltransferase [Acidobacteriota bacterium]
MPRVSVVIPTYNRRPLLAEALASVWAQTFDDLEVIVVDDGSTDDTRSYLDSLAEPRLRILAGPHRGASAATNTGIRAARGELIAHLDSDDVWLPDMLATEVAALDQDPGAGLVYARARLTDLALNPLPVTHGLPLRFPDDAYKSMLYEDCTCHNTVVARREVFDVVGLYDETLRSSLDWDIWLRFARRRRFVFVDQVTVLYRQHEGNMRAPARMAEVLENRTRVLDKAFAATDAPPGMSALRAMAYGNLHTECGAAYARAGQWGRAWRRFAQAFRTTDRKAFTLGRIAWFGLSRPALQALPGGPSAVAWAERTQRRLRTAAAAA